MHQVQVENEALRALDLESEFCRRGSTVRRSKAEPGQVTTSAYTETFKHPAIAKGLVKDGHADISLHRNTTYQNPGYNDKWHISFFNVAATALKPKGTTFKLRWNLPFGLASPNM